MENEKITTLKIPEFIRDLPLSDEQKHFLLMSIAKIMSTVAQDTGKMTTAACMGLSTDDPNFCVFYERDIAPLLEVDPQKIYEDLKVLILEKETTNE